MSTTNNISTSCDDKKSEHCNGAPKGSIVACAACGKRGSDLKVCTACKSVKYCNRNCQKLHWKAHKKECKELASELKVQNVIKDIDEMIISDDKLFAAPPPKEDCPICMLPMPYANEICDVVSIYMPCCGKHLCMGCIYATLDEIELGRLKDCCAFCRQPNPQSQEELLERVEKRIALDDFKAFDWLGGQYYHGKGGLPQDYNKGIELLIQAAEKGSIRAHNHLAQAYENGEGVERDVKRAFRHYKLAAIGGHEYARFTLGVEEFDNNGDIYLALEHFMIAAKSGEEDGMNNVEAAYKGKVIAKDVYESTLRAYKDSQNEMRSDQRTKALEDERKALENEKQQIRKNK